MRNPARQRDVLHSSAGKIGKITSIKYRVYCFQGDHSVLPHAVLLHTPSASALGTGCGVRAAVRATARSFPALLHSGTVRRHKCNQVGEAKLEGFFVCVSECLLASM